MLGNIDHGCTERINLDGNNLVHEMEACHHMALAWFILQLCEAKDNLSRSSATKDAFLAVRYVLCILVK
jgi:hypothetical protein